MVPIYDALRKRGGIGIVVRDSEGNIVLLLLILPLLR